ncbi:pectate lyase [Luteimonas suaedae]|uniref:pectate lyase n=1 Tax=Luteimonas suaedae TaxID=2605430 RepID=UPI001CA94C79|nr:pectate lyase [Luteimonas suaedae]
MAAGAVQDLGLAALLFAAASLLPAAAAGPGPIPLDGFADAIHHWQNLHGDDDPRHAPDDVATIADNIVLQQRRDGGWRENRDPARILDDDARRRLDAERDTAGGSFDNRNVYTQVEYLAQAHARTGIARFREASLRGLEFILAQQIEACGGWPHTVPASTSYHALITIADEVTPGVLATLRKAMAGSDGFVFVDDDLRARARAAVARGDACLLRLQVRQDGRATAWAGQYDPRTLAPAQGRSFELPAIVTQESIAVVRYLMSIPAPSPEVVAAVDAAVAWFRDVALHGVRLETSAAEPVRYRYHTATTDRRLVEDADAPPLWARFYDLTDNSVVLATREGERVARYADIPRERRTGYQWYGDWPHALLEREYPRWKRKVAAGD